MVECGGRGEEEGWEVVVVEEVGLVVVKVRPGGVGGLWAVGTWVWVCGAAALV